MHALLAAVLSHWLVVSDVHLDPYNTQTAVVYARDTNETLLASATAAMRRNVPDAQVVVLGGDMLAHQFGSLARAHREDPYAAGIAATRAALAPLARAYPRAQFLVTLGNNDDPCGDYRSETGGAYLQALERIYEPLVNRNGAAPGFARSFMRGGYYAASLPNGMRAIVLNTVVDSIVYRGGCQSHATDPAAAQRAWLASELARDRDAMLLMHVPPGFDPSSTTLARALVAVPFMRGDADASLRAVLQANASRIRFGIAGHTHRYDLRLAGGVPLLLVSSLSPVYRNNPAFYDLRVASDGTLHDVTPYVYDPSDGGWHAQPSFDRSYGVDAFTAPNLTRVHGALDRDADMRARWMAAYDAWSTQVGDISAQRWPVFWCAQTEYGTAYARCAGTRRRSFVAIATVAALLVVVAAGVVLVVRRRRARFDRA